MGDVRIFELSFLFHRFLSEEQVQQVWFLFRFEFWRSNNLSSSREYFSFLFSFINKEEVKVSLNLRSFKQDDFYEI